jgi:phosphoribosylpyrophosphate synthetase
MSATHAVFAPPAIDRLVDCPFTKLAITDSIPIGTRIDRISQHILKT